MRKTLLICLTACLLAACAGRTPVTPVAPAAEAPPAAAATAGADATPPLAAPAVAVAPPLAAENIFFLGGSIEIEPAERNKLRPYVERLKADPRLVLTLIGHTDDQGSRSYKLAIAQGRVDAVFAALRRLGVPARQMQRYPVGREKLVAGCNTAECRKTMRRVELVYRP